MSTRAPYLVVPTVLIFSRRKKCPTHDVGPVYIGSKKLKNGNTQNEKNKLKSERNHSSQAFEKERMNPWWNHHERKSTKDDENQRLARIETPQNNQPTDARRTNQKTQD
mmetsp:Transcript_12778/g.31937  ORF Transcript_12778/g.31937 Transcript_12778/m.31937 type:complete len:109 (-) Transcript_12778:174-500(-)